MVMFMCPQIEASEEQFVRRLEQFRKENLGAAKVRNFGVLR